MRPIPRLVAIAVVYAAFSGALRRYCMMRSEKGVTTAAVDKSTSVRALVPISFPRAADAPLTNDWTFVTTALPVTEETAAARLARAREIFSEIKVPAGRSHCNDLIKMPRP